MEEVTTTTQRPLSRRRSDTVLPPVTQAAARAWKGRGALGGSIAIGLAFAGQLAMLNGDEPTAGNYYFAAILMVLVALTHFAPKNTAPPSASSTLPTRAARSAANAAVSVQAANIRARYVSARQRAGVRLTVGGLVFTGVLAALSSLVLAGNVAGPLGGWLWAAAMLALALTFPGVVPRPRKSLLPEPGSDVFKRGIPILSSRVEWGFFGAILLAGIALRLYNLEYHPGIFGDEGERGIDALGINSGSGSNIFGYGWWNVPSLYFYCVALMLRVFGDTMTGVRMLSVLSGITALVYVYKTGKLLWGQRAGLIAMSLLAVSPLALQFSRQASESSPIGALWAAGMFYFLKALRDRRYSDWVLSGTLLSFGMYFYASGKLVVVLIAAALAYCLIRWQKRFFVVYGWGAPLMLCAFGLTFLPNAIFNVQDRWMKFAWRSQETAIFSQTLQESAFARYGIPFPHDWIFEPLPGSLLHHGTEWALLFYNQMRVTLEALYKLSDPTVFYHIGLHNGTMLSPLLAAIAMLGIAYAAWKLPDARFGLLNVWFWCGLLGTALTIDTPTVQRLTGAWPALMLFPAVLLDRMAASAWPLSVAAARKWSLIPIGALLIFFGAEGYQEYFVHYASLCPYCKATVQSRYVQELGQDYKAYDLGVGDTISIAYGSTRFLAKDVEGVDVAAPASILPVTGNIGKGLAFLVYPSNAQYIPLLRYFYPDGKEERVLGSDGQEYFVSYKVSREAVLRSQTAQAAYTWQGGHEERLEPGLGTTAAWSPPQGIRYPAHASWGTNLFVPQYGAYTFTVAGGSDTQLQIDGKPPVGAPQTNPSLTLARGLHQITVRATLTDPAVRVELRWAGSTGGMKTVPASSLYNGHTGGLLVEVGPLTTLDALRNGDPFGGKPPAERRIYPAVGFREAAESFNKEGFTLRWRGELAALKQGTYSFQTNTNGPCILRIDGKTVVDNTTVSDMSAASGTVQLAEGAHILEMLTIWGGGTAPMELYWSTPSEPYGLVPPSVLTPAAVQEP